jgi:hypothetical protein
MKVIKGGLLDEFVILPLEQQMKVQSVKITSTQTPWLNAMLVGVKTFDATAKGVISQVIHELRVSLALSSNSTTTPSGGPSTEKFDADQMKALAAGDSSDDNPITTKEPHHQSPTKTTPKAGTDRWHSVQVEEVNLTIFISSNSGSLFLKADDESIKKFVQLCFNAKGLHKAMNGRSIFLPGQSSGGFVPEAWVCDTMHPIRYECQRVRVLSWFIFVYLQCLMMAQGPCAFVCGCNVCGVHCLCVETTCNQYIVCWRLFATSAWCVGIR